MIILEEDKRHLKRGSELPTQVGLTEPERSLRRVKRAREENEGVPKRPRMRCHG